MGGTVAPKAKGSKFPLLFTYRKETNTIPRKLQIFKLSSIHERTTQPLNGTNGTTKAVGYFLERIEPLYPSVHWMGLCSWGLRGCYSLFLHLHQWSGTITTIPKVRLVGLQCAVERINTRSTVHACEDITRTRGTMEQARNRGNGAGGASPQKQQNHPYPTPSIALQPVPGLHPVSQPHLLSSNDHQPKLLPLLLAFQ